MKSPDYPYDTPIVGDAFSDHDLWQELYRIAGDRSQSIPARARAIRHMDLLTGEPESAPFAGDDAGLVADYENGMAQMTEDPTDA